MCEEEEKVRDGDPEPAALDEELVEEVALPCEVRRRKGGVVGLARCEVCRGAGGGVEQGEERAQEERGGVEEQEDGLHEGGDGGRVFCCHCWI